MDPITPEEASEHMAGDDASREWVVTVAFGRDVSHYPFRGTKADVSRLMSLYSCLDNVSRVEAQSTAFLSARRFILDMAAGYPDAVARFARLTAQRRPGRRPAP